MKLPCALRTIVGLLFAVAAAHAGPVACTTGSLSSYIALGGTGCTIGTNYTVDNFNYVVSAAVLANNITAADITVTPIDTGNGPEVSFSANWSASGVLASSYTGLLRFTAQSSGVPFTAFNSQTLATTGNTTGIGSIAAVSETNCVGGLLGASGVACLSGGVNENLGAQITSTSTSANAIVSFTPNTLVDVYKTISLTGIAHGSASLSSLSQTFGTATPEPATNAMFGMGLLMVFVHSRRVQKARQAKSAPIAS